MKQFHLSSPNENLNPQIYKINAYAYYHITIFINIQVHNEPTRKKHALYISIYTLSESGIGTFSGIKVYGRNKF